MKSAALFIATGGAMILYFQYEKARLERKRIVEMSKGYGKPKVGGPFNLRDLNGKDFTEKDLLGKYSLVCKICAETARGLACHTWVGSGQWLMILADLLWLFTLP